MVVLESKLKGATRVGAGEFWPDAEHFPFRSRYIDVDGTQVHYVDEGAGPPLLMLHSAPSSSFLYRRFILSLRSRFRCVALDYPGFGRSYVENGYQVNLIALSSVVEEFVRSLDLRDITLLVHDASGPIGLGAASRDPSRYSAFILTDTLGFPLDRYPLVRLALRAVTGTTFRALNRKLNLLPFLVSSFAPVRRRLSRAERQAYRRIFASPDSRDRIIDLFQELLRQPEYLRQVELGIRETLSDRPALLMYGQFDPTRLVGWPRRFEELFPRHRSKVIPLEGHFPHEGSPEVMIREIGNWHEALPSEAEGGK